MKPLTKAERYQFSLTGSSATTIPAQRAAIVRCGLVDATPASVRKARQSAYAAWKLTQKDLAKLPAWVAAARWEASGDDWLHVAPTPAGRRKEVPAFARLAYDAIDWGWLRKHSRGDATAFPPRRREETNGKSGWDCVTWRYADYLSVVSPDKTQLAVQVDGQPITVHPVFRSRCLYRGVRINLTADREIPRASITLRATARRLRLHGFDAHVIRQTPEMIGKGLGDNIRTGGQIVLVVPDGLGGWYHVDRGQSVATVRDALAKRRTLARQKELDEAIVRDGSRIWVTLEDSIAAGNCRSGTENFIADLRRAIGAEGEIGGATAAAILSTRDNEFTRRACRVAALRQSR